MTSPQVSVGITSGKEMDFTLSGIYSCGSQAVVTGSQHVALSSSGLAMDWNGMTVPSLLFTPTSCEGDSFELEGVTIGVNFHWERREAQRFRGSLRLIVADGKIIAINLIDVEEYLTSVISSEMKATSSLPLLRAHAVISRSWLLAQMEHRQQAMRRQPFDSAKEIVRWWDHDDHALFDVCADDHCQRYQGIGRVAGDDAAQAVSDTRGQVLTYAGRICDARFSKCCGGIMELFSSCWEDDDKPYLRARRDSLNPVDFPDLTLEENAEKWIAASPEAFCNCRDTRIISQVLNGYDLEKDGTGLYRWEISVSQSNIRTYIAKAIGRDLGEIIALNPLQRGPSGRIVRLEIVGSDDTVVIGKELMIRRALSESHLPSSAFIVTARNVDGRGVPQTFMLRGAGWGHGVGLCQIGAAVMGERGFGYEEILRHYYPDSTLTTLY